MAQTLMSSYGNTKDNMNIHKPSRLSMEGLQRTISDISFDLITKETATTMTTTTTESNSSSNLLPSISETEDGKCECCGMSEECTIEYMKRVRGKFLGKFVCGLCAEAVQQEMEKNGGKKEEAIDEHVSACVKFNRVCRVNPILYQAEAMREMLKRSSSISRAKSISPRDRDISGNVQKKGGIARSSSCIPALTREITDQKLVNKLI
ncbi:uncharacterized protein LOC126664788 [Mercurialis annua]|uniref:uncharacterized protein LOC126664788 n=1 Tax=Mercurialis annua TaxID=3986 RepID=UPI00215E3665|nr:uncharacterized protein LOC126664788 [Mercurialis annua]